MKKQDMTTLKALRGGLGNVNDGADGDGEAAQISGGASADAQNGTDSHVT